jgi:uncharacterized protein YkwD
MSHKIISAAVVVTTITLFSIASQPKTAVGTAAMTVGNFGTDFVMPTLRPFPTLNIESRIRPIVSTNPQSTSTPKPSVSSTPKASTQATTKPTITPQSITTNNSYTDQVISLVNTERSKAGLGSVSKNGQLTNSAQGYAQYMADANFFAHEGPNGSTFITRNKDAGYYPYHYLGENIAAGQRTPQEVMTAWMNSSGHRANILKPEYKEIGVGYTSKSGTTYGTYWAQEFGAK